MWESLLKIQILEPHLPATLDLEVWGGGLRNLSLTVVEGVLGPREIVNMYSNSKALSLVYSGVFEQTGWDEGNHPRNMIRLLNSRPECHLSNFYDCFNTKCT